MPSNDRRSSGGPLAPGAETDATDALATSHPRSKNRWARNANAKAHVYSEAARSAASVSAARREKRTDAMTLLSALGEERSVRRAQEVNAVSHLTTTTAAATPLARTASSTIQPSAKDKQHWFARANAAKHGGFGTWRPGGSTEVGDEGGCVSGADPFPGCAAIGSYMFPKQQTTAALGSAVPIHSLATAIVEAAGRRQPNVANNVRVNVAMPLHDAIAEVRKGGGSAVSALHLTQEVVRRCLAAQGWRAALAVAMSATSGAWIGRSSAGVERGKESVWQPRSATLPGQQTGAAAVAVFETLLVQMGRHQVDGVFMAPSDFESSFGSGRAADCGTWESSLACAAVIRSAAEQAVRHDRCTPKRAAAVYAHALLHAVGRRAPGPAELLHPRGVNVVNGSAFTPWEMTLRLFAVNQAWGAGKDSPFSTAPVAAPAAVRPPPGDIEQSFVSSSVDGSRAAAIVLAAACGGASLARLQGTVDRLCDIRPHYMSDPAVWAAYMRACGFIDLAPALRVDPMAPQARRPEERRTAPSATAWRHALEVMGSNSIQLGVPVTAAMYEAAIVAALAPDFAAAQWLVKRSAAKGSAYVVSTHLPEASSGWRLALRLYSRAETDGIAPSQCMLGYAALASALAQSRGWRRESSPESDDDDVSAMIGDAGGGRRRSEGADAPSLVRGVLAMPESCSALQHAAGDGAARDSILVRRRPLIATELQRIAGTIASGTNPRLGGVAPLPGAIDSAATTLVADRAPQLSAGPDADDFFF